jgi:hypothetical protein
MTLNQFDVEANLHSIKDAKRQARWILYSFHSHEGEGTEEGTGKGFSDEFCVDLAQSALMQALTCSSAMVRMSSEESRSIATNRSSTA